MMVYCVHAMNSALCARVLQPIDLNDLESLDPGLPAIAADCMKQFQEEVMSCCN
jgi:hypothetical protein